MATSEKKSRESLLKEKLPVALIIFNRPGPTEATMKAIGAYGPKELFIISDGPKDDEQRILVNKARQATLKVDWECRVTRIYSDVNLGLRRRILSGLDAVFSEVELCVVLEDDCLPSLEFFEFCGQVSPQLIHPSTSVGAISGNNFLNLGSRVKVRYSLIPRIWGWCTSSTVWADFRKFLSDYSHLGPYPQGLLPIPPFHIWRMLKKANGSNFANVDSWAMRFALFMLSEGLLTAFPPRNLVTNVGFGASATHTSFDLSIDSIPVGRVRQPFKLSRKPRPDYFELLFESVLRPLFWLKVLVRHPVLFTRKAISVLNKRRQIRIG